ncbi:MAG: hypothetical protein R3313_04890 [Candidatus Saccharimonadales bacterium]|nr:hypothetical protein [Candidatus Saccharimonadales bacterium]
MADNQKKLAKFIAAYAKRQHLVNLGNVDANDEHSKIGGFLLQPKHKDYAYSQGHVQGLDISLAVRSVSLPNYPEIITRLILEVSLPEDFPHVIALGDEHDEDYFRSLLARYHHYARSDIGPWKMFAEATIMPEIAHLKELLLKVHELEVADAELEGQSLRLYIHDFERQDEIDLLVSAVKDLFLES